MTGETIVVQFGGCTCTYAMHQGRCIKVVEPTCPHCGEAVDMPGAPPRKETT